MCYDVPMTNQAYKPAPMPTFVTPPKTPVRVHPVLAGVIALVALVLGVGFGSANAKPTVAVPAPAVTTTATATVTTTVTAAAPAAQKATSQNVLAMESAWSSQAATDRETIRSPWRDAQGSPSAEAYVISVYLPIVQKSIPSFTEAELREFLDWTLTQK